jgi:phage terminase small subunit
MSQRTAEKRVSELLPNAGVKARIDALRAEAAAKAVLSQSFVLEQLQRQVRICMGNERVKIAVRPRDAKDAVSVVEVAITCRDAAAANRALELLGKHLGVFDGQGDNVYPGQPYAEAESISASAEWVRKLLAEHEANRA